MGRRRRVAIVGSGISGLIAARTLHPRHAITVYEAAGAPGGHARTVALPGGIGVDTGFIVFNERTYPGFTTLLRELGVASQPGDMSFSVSCRRCGIEYSSRGLAGLFAHPSQVFRPTLYRIATDVLRFNAWARQGAASLIDENATIGDLQAQGRFGPDFFRHYLLPMSSAIWSAAACDAVRLPLAFLLRFFDNHGLLQVRGQPPWRTVTGGSRRYVEALIRPFEDRVRLHAAVDRLRRDGGGVEVHTRDMGWERYDEAVVATHADQALALIEQPDDEEREALGAIPYRRNVATLHTDSRVLPRAAAAWASWNTQVEDCGDRRAPLRMTYHMNRLQRLPDGTDYLVTLNDEDRIDAARVLARHVYEHPVYSTAGLGARKALRAMNGRRRTFYCGAYLGNGFHEDGLRAGVEVGEAIDRRQEAA